MDAVKYLKERSRMCKSFNTYCEGCPMNGNGKEDLCSRLKFDGFEEMVEIVEKWSLENPQKTILQDFLEKYPNAPIDENDKTPIICPYSVGYEKEEAHICLSDCMSCWNRPLEG